MRRSFCGVIRLDVAKAWAGSFAVLVFPTFLNTTIS